jgi:hypothetical protein
MGIRIHLPVEIHQPADTAAQRTLAGLAGRKLVFLSNHRGRNAEIFSALQEVLTKRFGARSVTEHAVGHGRSAPPESFAPLAQQYDAAISAIGA